MGILRNGGKVFFAGIFTLQDKGNLNDAVSKDMPTFKKIEAEEEALNVTGWERLQNIFQIDEFDRLSPELNSIYQTGFLGFLTGVMYGGITQSRVAYMDFMENNQATAFQSHLDAKRKLQDSFTVNFAKGAFRWGWRLGLFTTSYYGIITCISTFRGKSSIYEYLAAGTLTGAMYKVNMGLRGMTAGGIFGCAFGGLAGAVSLLLMYASGTTMQDMRVWQHKWHTSRNDAIRQAFRKHEEEQSGTPEVFVRHDENLNKNSTLENIK